MSTTNFSLSGRNDNNRERATTGAELRTTARNQDLGSCLDNLRAWHELHPGHGLIVVKLELKSGFAASGGSCSWCRPVPCPPRRLLTASTQERPGADPGRPAAAGRMVEVRGN